MTREERNVLVFLAVGIVLGAWPPRGHEGVGEAPVSPAGELDASAEPVVRDLFPIDLNRASAELLAELPGIGPARAGAIVERRRRVGPFRTVGELADVRGIGPRTVERLRDLVTVAARDTGERESKALGEPTGNAPPGERDPHAAADGAGEEPGEVER